MQKKFKQVSSLKLLAAQVVIDLLENNDLLNQLTDPSQFPPELADFIKSIMDRDNLSLMFPCIFERDKILVGHNGPVTAVALNIPLDCALTGSEDLTIRLWDLQGGTCTKIFEGHRSTITALAFDQDDKRIASGSEDGSVRIWDKESGECLAEIKGYVDEEYPLIQAIRILEFNGDNKLEYEDATSRIQWNCQSDMKARTRNLVKLDSDEKYYVLHLEDDYFNGGNICISKLVQDSDKYVEGPILSVLKGHPCSMFSIKISPDDTVVLIGYDLGIMKLWDIKTGKCLNTFIDHIGIVFVVGFSKNSKKFFSVASDGQRIQIKNWEVKTGRRYSSITIRTDKIPFMGKARSENKYTIYFSDGTELIVEDDRYRWINHRVVIDRKLALVAFSEGGFCISSSESELLYEDSLPISSQDGDAISKHFDLGWDQNLLIILFGLDDGICQLVKYHNLLSLKQLAFINELKNKNWNEEEMIIDKEILASFEPRVLDFLKREFKDQLSSSFFKRCIVS